MRIVAPFDGVAGIRSINLGDYVKDGADLVNIEDLSIDHDQEREVGWLSVQVAPERADELAVAMAAAGWTVRDREPQD